MKHKDFSGYYVWALLALIVGLAVFYYLTRVNYRYVDSTGDNYTYQLIAQSVFTSHPFMVNVKFDFYDDHGIFHHQRSFPPLYPIMIALIHKIFGSGMYVMVYATIVCAMLCAVPVFLMGRLLSSAQAAVIVAMLTVFSQTLVITSYLAISEPLFTLMSLFSLYFLLVYDKKQALKYLVVSAVFSGLSYLTRANGLAVIVAAAGYLVIRNGFLKKRVPWRQTGLDLLVYLGIVLLVIFPWLLRNYLVFGDPFYYVGRFFAGLTPGKSYAGIFAEAPTLERFLQNSSIAEIYSRYSASVVEHLLLIWKELSFLSLLAVGSLLIWPRKRGPLLIIWLYLVLNFLISLFHPSVYSRHLINTFPPLYLLAVVFAFEFRPADLFKRPLSRKGRRTVRIALLLTLLSGATTVLYQDLTFPQETGFFASVYAPVGNWIKQNSPADAIVMSNKTSPIAYYAQRPVVMLPLYTSRRNFDRVVSDYQVDFIVTFGYENYLPSNFVLKWQRMLETQKNRRYAIKIYQRVPLLSKM